MSEEESYINVSQQSYKRVIGDGLRNVKPWSSDLTAASAFIRSVFSGTMLEPKTRQPRVGDIELRGKIDKKNMSVS
ncbi:hypothetical protein TNCV_1893121 [Trichonephila clavipes]|nr:hypothetical protein TNCV_1893121 [Trichonephila clavipes]